MWFTLSVLCLPPGTSEDLFQDSEGREGSEPIEEHQFSDLEESDDDDDNEDEEDEEEEESQEEPGPRLPEGKPGPLLPHPSGGSPSSPEEGTQTSTAPEAAPSAPKAGEEGQQASSSSSSSSGLESKWSADSSDIAVCHSFLSLHRAALTFTERLAPAERESVTRPPMSLPVDLSTSKDTSPRKRWSPSQECGRGGGSSSRAMIARKHLLTKNETSPKRFSPTAELPSSLRCLSPGRGLSPCQRLSPRREASPLRCVSPRLELSPSRRLSPRRELSLPPDGEVSPARHSSPSREMASLRYFSLKKVLSPGCLELARYPPPGKEDSPGTSKSAEDKVPSSYQAQPGIFSSMPLPHRFFGKNLQLYESKLVSPVPCCPLVPTGWSLMWVLVKVVMQKCTGAL